MSVLSGSRINVLTNGLINGVDVWDHSEAGCQGGVQGGGTGEWPLMWAVLLGGAAGREPAARGPPLVHMEAVRMHVSLGPHPF